MNKDFITFSITDFDRTKRQMLHWLNSFNICCFLDNHQYHTQHNSYECLAGAGALEIVEANAGNALSQFGRFLEDSSLWLFGHLGYDLKNELEPLVSSHPDNIGFSDLFFFVPEVVLLLNEHELAICASGPLSASQIFDAIVSVPLKDDFQQEIAIDIHNRFTRQEYLESVERIKRHIQRGDCYEINFCQEFFAENTQLNPVELYHSLSNASPNPFAAYYKLDDKYLLCASPERYLKKIKDKIISQPIKGTARRNLQNTLSDELNKEKLRHSPKERSENVMVVDLVRNDLSRICQEGTVKADELFGIYSFPQVHQMISTISGKLKPGISFSEIVKATFPMGSMTGAPKRKVMQLIEQYEKTKRGIFSGALGYITPEGNFDFNVVIRSICYNLTTQYLSFQVGSAITFYSKAEEELEECLVKATAIKKVLDPPALYK